MTLKNYPRIVPVCDPLSENPSSILYSGSIRTALRRLFPNECLWNEQEEGKELVLLEAFHHRLPMILWSEWGGSPLNLSVFLLCRYRLHVGKFFYEMMSRWLIPGKRLNVSLFFSTDFQMPDVSEELYTFSEIIISVENIQELETIRRNLPLLEVEIRLGAMSLYHANRILEMKGLSADEKTSLIQERIASLVRKRPQDFDYDIFIQMQHFLVTCREEFKVAHEHLQMSRIISTFYLFHRFLKRQVELECNKRHLSLKIAHTRLHLPLGVKQAIAVFVGMNFLKENEIFEERHLIKAIRKCIPHADPIEDSFFASENQEDRIQLTYLEIVKRDDTKFTLEEIKYLQKGLSEELKNQVEHLIRPVFMPRNEEEVMRNIVTLSHQLKYVRDLPQVIISFDEQTDSDVSFTVILLRILQEGSLPIQQILEQAKADFTFTVDRIKRVGALRKKHPKEATVLRVRLPNGTFLRGDHSVDLYKARQEVLLQLQKMIGEVRDYNGGMISKQLEIFVALKELLGDVGQNREFLLENFFHSITPVEHKSVVDPRFLGILFRMLLNVENAMNAEKKKYYLQGLREEGSFFIMIALQDTIKRQEIFNVIEQKQVHPSKLISVHLQIFEIIYIGYIYFNDDKTINETFFKSIQQALDF